MEDNDVLIPQELIDIVLTQFYRIYNGLGYGFLERVYHDGRVVGDFRADLFV